MVKRKWASIAMKLGTKIIVTSLAILILLVLIAGTGVLVLKSGLPSVTVLETCFEGSMNNVKVCPQEKNYVKLPDVSQKFIDALIVSEDASFWQHNGFDWFELKESLKTNVLSGGYKRGASTISQQLIKNSFLTPEKSISRKLKEFFLTREMESKFSKEFILEKYLNIVEFGPDLYGLDEASRYYFFKAPNQLNVLESGYLVHLLPNPKTYSTTFEKGELTDFSKRMVLLIAKRLHYYKKITDEEYEFAQTHIDRFPWYSLPKGPVYWESIDDLLDEETDSVEGGDSTDLEKSLEDLDQLDEVPENLPRNLITF